MSKFACLLLLLLPLSVACGGSNSSTGPTPLLAVPEVASSGGGSKVSALAFDPFLRRKVQWTNNGESLKAFLNPPYDVEIDGHLTKILLQVNDSATSPQVMLGFSAAKYAERGVPTTWEVELPCGKHIEGELYVSDVPVPNTQISGGYLVAIYYGETAPCNPIPAPSPSPSPC
jgi:hypothetical protein